MYKVYISFDYMNTYDTIHDPTVDGDDSIEVLLASGKISKAINEISSFVFTIYPNNKFWEVFGCGGNSYNHSQPTYTTFLKVIRIDREGVENIEFEGRVISVSPRMDSDGMAYSEVVCEGVEALLLDVQIDTNDILKPGIKVIPPKCDPTWRDFTWYTTLMDDGTYKVKDIWMFSQILKEYNRQAPYWARIEEGKVLNDPYDSASETGGLDIYVAPTYGACAYDLITDALDYDVLNPFTKALVVERVNGKLTANILDMGFYLKHDLEVWIAHNEIAVNLTRNDTDIITCIVPLGAETSEETEYYDEVDGETYTYDKCTRWTMGDYGDVLDDAKDGFFAEKLREAGLSYDRSRNLLINNKVAEKYGRIAKTFTLDIYSERETEDGEGTEKYISLENAHLFFNKCWEYLYEQVKKQDGSLSVTVCDLSMLSEKERRLFERTTMSDPYITAHPQILTRASVTNPLINLTDERWIIATTVDIMNPADVTIELGERLPRQFGNLRKKAKEKAKEKSGYGTKSNDNYEPVRSGKRSKSNNNSSNKNGGTYYVSDVVNWVAAQRMDTSGTVEQFRYKPMSRTTTLQYDMYLDLQMLSDKLGFEDKINIKFSDLSDEATGAHNVGYYDIYNMKFNITDIAVSNVLYKGRRIQTGTDAYYTDVILVEPPIWDIEIYNDKPALHVFFSVKSIVDHGTINYAPWLRINVIKESKTSGPSYSGSNVSNSTDIARNTVLWNALINQDTSWLGGSVT